MPPPQESDEARRAIRAFEIASELWSTCPVPSMRKHCRCEKCQLTKGGIEPDPERT